jgi:cytochrome bd-type quinol oxidase subunit 2
MQFIISLALLFLGFIVYLALSKKSSRMVRLAALIALAVIILAITVCMIIIFSAQEAGADAGPVDFVTGEPAASVSNNFNIIILAIFVLALLGAVIILSLREQRKALKEKDDSR